MKELLIVASHYSVLLIDAMALVIVMAGTIEAFLRGIHILLSSASGHERRDVWLRYARWLVAALTFQLAADIIETAVAPTWDDIGRLGVIAVVRTLLNYFLERDLTEVRERQEVREGANDVVRHGDQHRRLEVEHA